VRVARALTDLPRISAAFERAGLSYSKVRAITRIADPENEQDWLAVALEATASQLEKLVRACRRAGRTETEQANRQHEGRYLRYHFDEQGMLVLQGRLPAEMGAAVVKALEAAEDALFSTPKNNESGSHGGEPRRCACAGDVSAETSAQGIANNETESGCVVGPAHNSTWEQRSADTLVLAGDPVRILARRNQQAGLQITSDTNNPRWDGTPVDYGYAVAALLRSSDPASATPSGG